MKTKEEIKEEIIHMNYEDEIKRLNEKIEFLARTNMLYSDWEHRDTQVTSQLIRKGIEEGKINAELRAEIQSLKQRTWVGLTQEEFEKLINDAGFTRSDLLMMGACIEQIVDLVEAKLKEKNI